MAREFVSTVSNELLPAIVHSLQGGRMPLQLQKKGAVIVVGIGNLKLLRISEKLAAQLFLQYILPWMQAAAAGGCTAVPSPAKGC